MTEENKRREGKRAIKPSRKQIIKLAVLGTVAALLLALVITLVVLPSRLPSSPHPNSLTAPILPLPILQTPAIMKHRVTTKPREQ